MKHKHADVLIAIAEGKIVQYRDECSDWRDADFSVLENYTDPITFPYKEWRIKPESKPDLVKYLGTNKFGNKIWNMLETDFNIISHWNSQLKLTFDGETGKLKKAEVL